MKILGLVTLLTIVSIWATLARADENASSLRRWDPMIKNILQHKPEFSAQALENAFFYLVSHSSGIKNKNYITVVDFSLPSTVERMVVINLRTGASRSFLVAHGEGSGHDYANHFSNQENSLMSSLGVYLTGKEYLGSNGLSMILKGQQETNSNAERRKIVLHGADYVSYEYLRAHGQLDTSWGCPAIDHKYEQELVHKLENGSVFYIYHPDLDRN